jgi:hypothetical protein
MGVYFYGVKRRETVIADLAKITDPIVRTLAGIFAPVLVSVVLILKNADHLDWDISSLLHLYLYLATPLVICGQIIFSRALTLKMGEFEQGQLKQHFTYYVDIVYSSNDKKSKEIAEELAKAKEMEGFEVDLVTIDDFNPNSMLREAVVLIFVINEYVQRHGHEC